MIRKLLVSILLLVTGCVSTDSTNPNWLLMNYTDFGPQVIAQEIIGMEWWQWQDHGDSVDRSYAIKVVVYNDIAEEIAKRAFPVNPEKNLDYRYVEYEKALEYLDEKIDENVVESVTEKLNGTREVLLKHFNSLRRPALQ